MATLSAIEWAGPASRVAFSGDFLRFQPVDGRFSSWQTRNIAWLREIVSGTPAWRRPGLHIETVCPAPGMALSAQNGVGAAALDDYRSDAEAAWARRYDTADPDVFAPQFRALAAADLVVGFEMPPTLKRLLHRNGRPYISLQIHALRMLRDLCFGATTNCPYIAHELQRCLLPAAAVDTQVSRHRAACAALNLPVFKMPIGLPVLIGQTERDSILIQDGHFQGWSDHREAVAEALHGHDALILLEHPYRPSSIDIAEHLRTEHGKTVFSTNANGYGVLLLNPGIPVVLTLASSLGVEAQALGLPTRFILGHPSDRLCVRDVDLPPIGPLGHAVLGDDFWRGLIGTRSKTDRQVDRATERAIAPPPTPHTGPAFALGDDHLRSSLESWSYRQLHDRFPAARNRTLLLAAATQAPARLQALVQQLGDAGLPGHGNGQPIAPWHSSGIDLQCVDPALQLGESRSVRLDTAAATLYLARGFHAAEDWGCWTSQHHAQLRVALATQAVAQGARLGLRLTLRPYHALLPRYPVVRVASGGQTLAFVFFRPGQGDAQDIEVDMPACAATCWIDLEISDVASPARLLESADTRQIGIALLRLDLSCQPAQPDTAAEAAASPPFLAVGIGPTPIHCTPTCNTEATA